MMDAMRLDVGAAVFTQSHKNILRPQAINVFTQMAHDHDIFDQKTIQKIIQDPENMPEGSLASRTQNSYTMGFRKLLAEIKSDPQLTRFKIHMVLDSPSSGAEQNNDLNLAETEGPIAMEL
jgi:hypothetical protein